MQNATNARSRAGRGEPKRFFWRRVLWSLVFPARDQRVMVTLPGLVLIGLAVAVGVAAYNTASNILFLTLSLLLGCLILSGILSWLNFRRLRWDLEIVAPMRVGREHPVVLRIHNLKTFLPSYALSFDLSASSLPKPVPIPLRGRIDPRGDASLAWSVCPQRRGLERVELKRVGSLFPFGFLYKSIATETAREVVVWPAPIEYRRFRVAAWQRLHAGHAVSRAGQNGDLFALRRYQAGDSHRQIHWKVSARLRRMVVRQFAADTQEALVLLVTTSESVWKTPEQFELLCSLAATLAEDLFKQGQLEAVAIDDEAPLPVRGVRDLEAFLDRLAMLQPQATGVEREPAQTRLAGRRNLLSFAPDGPRGVTAFIDGEKAAST